MVSIIIPTFNRAHLLVRAIQSAICQVYEDVEIIVIDDGSDDNTQEVVIELAKHSLKQIKYTRKVTGGCASARNKGFEIASGNAFVFLDSDDELEPNAIQALAGKQVESNADLVYSPSIEISADGSEYVNYPVAVDQPENVAFEHFMETNVRTGAYLFTKSALDKVGGLDEKLTYNEDQISFNDWRFFAEQSIPLFPLLKYFTIVVINPTIG